jgi:cytochrome P450 family 130
MQQTTFRFNPAQRDFIEDPYPTYRMLRDEAPAYFDDASGYWLVSRYSDVARILADPATFSSAKGNAIIDSPLRVGKTLGSMDPPRHDELRRVVMRGVAPARIGAMLAPLRAHVRRVLATLARQRQCDLVSEIGRPVLYGALGRMLGLDDQAADRAVEVSKNLFHAGLGPTGSPLTPEGFRDVFAFLSEQVEKRKTERGDDIISVLLDARDAGASLSDEEIIANMTTVLLAGNASIGHYFTNLMYALWRFPDQRSAVRNNLGKLDDAIEEGVRWDTSTQCFARQTTKEIELAGVAIPADSRLVVFFASANRDERVIPDPDRYDVGRGKVRHFGFGAGPHFCLGAQAARHMLRVILEELLPALGDYELDMANAQRVPHLMVRGFSRLPMRW